MDVTHVSANPVSRKRPRTPAAANNGPFIWCGHCAKCFPWPPGSKEEARLYRVFLIDEEKKTFYCDADCYWNYRHPPSDEKEEGHPAAGSENAQDADVGYGFRPFPAHQDKHYLNQFGLDGFGGTGIDWGAKSIPSPVTQSESGENSSSDDDDDDDDDTFLRDALDLNNNNNNVDGCSPVGEASSAMETEVS